MKRVKKIGFAIITGILSLIIIFNVYNVFCVKILKKDLATVNGYAVLEVVSGSMEPTIHVGDLIVINTKNSDYKEKDIITFYDKEGSFVTHRIIEINEDKMITKGDNNDSLDEELNVDNIVGKYAFRIPALGRVIASFKSPFVMIMILVIGVLACIYISTDKEGKPILDEEEKEFQEFLKNKEEQEIKKEEKEVKKSSTTKKKSSSSTKSSGAKKVPSKKTTKRK